MLEDEIGGALSECQREFVEAIQQGARRLQNLVDDLLDSARMDAGSFKLRVERTDLAAKVREVLTSLRPQIEEARLEATLVLPEEPLEAPFDERRIEQVWSLVDLDALRAQAAAFRDGGSARAAGGVPPHSSR